MSAALGHAIRVVGAHLRIAVLQALAYRVGFWSEGVLGIVWSLLGVAPLWVALEHRPDVAGWTAYELLVLTGCYTAVSGAFGALLQPALVETMGRIRMGTFDYLLLRPAGALLQALVGAFNPWRLMEVVAGLVLVVVGVWGARVVPGPLDVVAALLILGAGLVALWSLGVLVAAASFFALALENLTFLMEAGLDFARWPISVFRGPLKALFTFVVPFALMTSYPAQVVLGRGGAELLPGALLTAGILAMLAMLAWRRALASYTSASS
jgi:ABC-2 type transport system permease protein